MWKKTGRGEGSPLGKGEGVRSTIYFTGTVGRRLLRGGDLKEWVETV